MTKQQPAQRMPDTLENNGAGYNDPTAYKAIRNIAKIQDEDRQATILIGVLKTIAELIGFKFAKRFVLIHNKTGKIYK